MIPSKKPLIPFSLSRRQVLRGLAGGLAATVALPVLDVMLDSHGEALAGGVPFPKRFATFLFGNGVMTNRWVPGTLGPAWELTEELAPLAMVKDYCTVLSGFENKIPPITHHEGMAGMFSGHPYVTTGPLESHFGGPSIDQVAANHISDGAAYRSLEIGISKRVSMNEGPTMQYLAHRDAATPLAPEYSPLALFNRLFDTALPTDPSRALRVSVLDAVKDDAWRLRNQLGANDRIRLEAHLESIHELQQQISTVPLGCNVPTTPTEENIDIAGAEPMVAVADAMTDLLVAAWACDLSRVASYMLTGGVGFTVYSHLGQNLEQHNQLSHQPTTYPEELNATIVWNVQKFADLLQKLKNTSEGTGNLLDSALLIMGSDCAEGWDHSADDMPVVIAGKAGGALTYPGIHHRATGGRNLTDALLAAVQAVAPLVTELGSDEGYSNTPVTQILT